MPSDTTSRVALITGGGAGIGYATAAGLARAGCETVIVGRDPARTAAAVTALRRDVPGASIDSLIADLSVQAHVRALAAAFGERHHRLDVLVNNAGTIVARRTLTVDGIERTLAVNHLAPFLLTQLLSERLSAAAPARVINVSSVAHGHRPLDLDDLQSARGYRPYRAYATSKLCNLIATYELARHLAGTGVTANAINPGLVRTGLGRGNGPLLDLAWGLTHLRHRAVSQTPEHAAGAIVSAATDPTLETVSGEYLSDGRPEKTSAASRDRNTAAALWTLSEQLCGIGSVTSAVPPRAAQATS